MNVFVVFKGIEHEDNYIAGIYSHKYMAIDKASELRRDIQLEGAGCEMRDVILCGEDNILYYTNGYDFISVEKHEVK